MTSGSEPSQRIEQPTTAEAATGREPDARAQARRALAADTHPAAPEPPGVMIPARGRRLPFETAVMRVVSTAGVVGICVAIAAIMSSNHSKGWLIGLVVSLVSVILAAFLWSSRRL